MDTRLGALSRAPSLSRAGCRDRDPSRDRGETLLELIIAVVIMGVAVVAIVGGLATSILVSDMHRKQATAGASARDYAETIEAWVAAGHYDGGAAPDYGPATVHFTAPGGFTASVQSVKCWNTAGSSWQSCGTDVGLEQVTVQVRSADGRAAEQVVVVLRRPCGLSDSLCA
jgi:type II secretory pathway pseudopilin PulG